MHFYKLTISYDGTNYLGWQEQKKGKTVCGQLKKVFKQTFNTEIAIIGASRTDAGVHSLHQVAVAKTTLKIKDEQLKKAWNNSLPEDILITDLISCDKSFNPLKNVAQKIYVYQFCLERPLPFYSRYTFFYSRKVNIDKLKECLKIFIGTHDFRSFCTGNEKKNTIRTIDDIKLIEKDNLGIYKIEIKGKAFLHHMIRRIIGACFEIASQNEIEASYLKGVIKQKNPAQSLPNIDAKGLILYKITYE